MSAPLALGLDFGTLSVRALLVTLTGKEIASASVNYPHGVLSDTLPTTGEKLPPDFALQHPQDWLDASASAVRRALKLGRVAPEQVISLGVDFTSCTVLPCRHDGTPLCLVKPYTDRIHAWPKLWKHHGALTQTARLNQIAHERHETFLQRYGNTIGLEWLHPKLLEITEQDRKTFAATELFLEAGDWFVWQLIDPATHRLPVRSTCMAGYKALWNASTGFASDDFLAAVSPHWKHGLSHLLQGPLKAPGQLAGRLGVPMAKRLGLSPDIAVSTAIIDAHAGVPGAGVAEPDVLVMVMGTSSCHMLNSRTEKFIPGVAGVVAGGILPEMFGYETGQAAVGDSFDWWRKMIGHPNFDQLNQGAAQLAPGAEGVQCLDWFNGCRTPLMDGSLRGELLGLSLQHTSVHVYRALMEASAFGLRWIIDLLTDGGITIKRCVATGGLPHHNPLLVQIYADVTGLPITIHPSKQGPAMGAAILGVLAAGSAYTGNQSARQIIKAIGHPSQSPAPLIKPRISNHRRYQSLYENYRTLATLSQR